MTLTRSFIRGATTTPLDARIMNMATIVANSDGSPRTGVLGASNASILSAKATMHVAVAAAEFATSKGRADGVAIFGNDGSVDVAIPAAPASNSRIDVIYVKHNDAETGDANSLPIFGVASGAAAASPTKPSIPTGALELGTLRVYAGTTASNGGSNVLTNTYRMTAARGGSVAVRTKTELDAWTNAAPGQHAFILGTGEEYVRDGGEWGTGRTPYAMAAGQYTPATAGFHTVSLPAGRFTAPPIVTASIVSGAGSAIGAAIRLLNVTTTSFQVSVEGANPISWHAVQMTPSSGEG